ncbi:MAG TPA: TIGR03067 domain-containing protein [Gemmataceae bacterium]|jgi:uncharacterized protein (TIGR03067 family)|nr:TIGR03067 domain-containing protein [Gemmataceae bacterium]
MTRFVSAVALVVCAGFAAAEDKFDAKKLEGKWTITAGWKEGAKVDAKNLEGEVTIAADTITIKAPDMTHVMGYKLDGMKIDMVGKEGPAKDIKAEGLIEMKGEELHLAYVAQIPGMEAKRPTKVESTKENKALYFVMKKAK